MRNIKCVLVGNAAVGKTSLKFTFVTGSFPSEYTPTLFDYMTINIMYKDKSIKLNIYEIAGVDEPDFLLEHYAPNTDIFIFCFSLVCPNSLEGVSDFWAPKIIEKYPKIPYILAGLKSDLRDDLIKSKNYDKSEYYMPISTSQGERTKKIINAHDYLECSSLKNYNLHDVFSSAIQQALINQKNRFPNDSKSSKKVRCQIY